MKKTMFIILLVITTLLIISCPQNVVKGTVWEGTIKGTFGGTASEDKNDLEFYFTPANIMKAFITYTNSGSGNIETISAEGKYTIGNNHAITATLEGEWSGTDFEIEITGVVNYYTGQGSGKYELTTNGTKFEDDWDLMKIGSY